MQEINKISIIHFQVPTNPYYFNFQKNAIQVRNVIKSSAALKLIISCGFWLTLGKAGGKLKLFGSKIIHIFITLAYLRS